jgi:DNA repair exonuclease SbcCD nuclease subunit
MSKTLIFSDVHVHPHKRKTDRLEDCLKSLEWVFETAKKHNIRDIVFGGDLFHDRQRIEVFTYHRTFETLEKYLDGYFKLYLLLGNHDLWFNQATTITSVKPFSAMPGVQIIDKPSRLSIAGANWDFIPFTHDPIAAIKELNALEGEAKIAVGHIALDGAILHGTHHADVSVEHDGDMVVVGEQIFADYNRVFLGHYHIAQHINDRIEYVGSPLQLSFGEAYQDKHIIIYDPETDSREYVKNTFSPKHYVITPDEVTKYDLERCFVRVIVDDLSTTDIVEVKNQIMNVAHPGTLEITQKKKKVDDNLVKDAKVVLTHGDDMLNRWLELRGVEFGKKDQTKQNLDKDKLLNIARKICQTNN